MKNTFKLILGFLAMVAVAASCTKEGPLFDNQTAGNFGFSLEKTLLFPRAPDSNKFELQLSWNNARFATAFENVKYITEIDMEGNDFKNPLTKTILGSLSDSFQNKVINAFVLDRGTPFGEYARLQIRVTASYSNNNDQRVSGPIPFQFRAYKIPPRVALPTTQKLFLVGNATQGGWNNPVPAPSQEFARLSETSWGGVFFLNGGGQFLVLPQNGSWDRKYSVQNSNLPGLAEGGVFGADLPGNFPGPANDGFYKIVLDFQQGTFTVEPFTGQHGLPSTLVVVGGASPGGWDNNANNTQRFSRLNSSEFQITINLKADDAYLILPTAGSWDRKFGVPNRSLESARLEGQIVAEGQDFKSPTEAGNYRINVNFVTGMYKLTKL